MTDNLLHDPASPETSQVAEIRPPQLLEPRLIEPGLEVAPTTEQDKHYISNFQEGDKEVVNQGEKEVASSQETAHHWISPSKPHGRRLCGLRPVVFWALLLAVLLVLALAIGLGVGLSQRDSDEASPASDNNTSTIESPSPTSPVTDELRIGGSINQSYYSTSGAWNGSAIAQTWQNFYQNFSDTNTVNEHEIVLYYQHISGWIRWLRWTNDTTEPWKPGPSDVAVVAEDARNSTAMTAIHWSLNATSNWHVFYVDSSDRVRQRSGNNQSAEWTEGPIAKAELQAWNGDLVGMQVCWALDDTVPMRLFYASDNTTFEEYLWYAQAETWTWQRSWKGYSAAAGVGCYQGGPRYRYAGFVNLDNQIEIWYQDKGRPITSDWLKATNNIDNVHSASSVQLLQPALVYQEHITNNIKVSAIIWDGLRTRLTDDYLPAAGHEGVSGTRIEAMQSGDAIYIWYQYRGEDITQLSRNLATQTEWTTGILPVQNV